MNRLWPSLLLFLSLLLAFGLAGTGKALASPVDNSLVIALEQFPTILNPAIASGSLTSQVGAQLFAGLVRMGPEGPEPYLATGWEINQDATSFCLYLRPNATFHDGTPITAKDVIFSLRTVQQYHPFRAMLASVSRITATDSHTVIIETDIPQPKLLHALIPALVPIIPEHIYTGTVPLPDHPANRFPVGSGPFQLAEVNAGRSIVLKRYPHFFIPDRPRLETIVFRVYWDQNEIPLALRQGEADVYAFSSLLDEEAIFARDTHLEVTRKEFAPLHPFAVLTFNHNNPFFQSPAVRKALAMSIDNTRLVESLFGNKAAPMYGPIPPGSALYTPVFTPYDPAEANRILDSAGYPRSQNGIRFSVDIDYDPTALFSLSLLKYLQKEFIRTVGVYLRIRTSANAIEWAARLVRGDYDVTLDELFGWHDPTIGIERLYRINTTPILWSNLSRYADAHIDSLFRAASAARTDRGAHYARLQHLLAQSHVALWICTIPYASIRNRQILHLTDQPFGVLSPMDKACWNGS